jgi:hypothetical protein
VNQQCAGRHMLSAGAQTGHALAGVKKLAADSSMRSTDETAGADRGDRICHILRVELTSSQQRASATHKRQLLELYGFSESSAYRERSSTPVVAVP